jgi:hypothetical protein
MQVMERLGTDQRFGRIADASRAHVVRATPTI